MNTSTNSKTFSKRFLLPIILLSVWSAPGRPAGAAPIAGPAGLAVVRNSEYNNVVSWHAVAGAISYTLQHRSLYPANQWTNVPGCNPASTTCTDITGTTSAYAYRVQALNGTSSTGWSNVAVFLSEPQNDGYLVGPPFSTGSTVADAPQPGIRAGQDIPGNTDLTGFLSFHTSSLGSMTQVLGAKLRLRQATNNDAFNLLGPCMVDIQKGAFSNNAALEINDFYYQDVNTTIDAFAITGVGLDQWFEAVVGMADQVSNTDYTQFRIYFNHSDLINKYAGWYSGESDDSPPQLIVRYKKL